MDAIDLREIHRQLEELRIRCDYIEGYQRNAESGTTACSAAGGGIEKMKTARSAGRAPCLTEVLEYLQKERWSYERLMRLSDMERREYYMLRKIYRAVELMEIEARR